ncbi:MAG: SIMPL domain-containing protein [Roseiarcus sp.]|uniref:SIMPL domain-containing protein n=1 Tax=Roseiarcus sp. TaxID=1969460 RepID=UPI003BB16CCD
MTFRSLGIMGSLIALGAVSSAFAQTRLLEVNNERLVEVAGEASISAKPDFARVTLGVTTTGKDASAAMAANAKSVNALIALIKEEGVAAADIQTSSLSISPQFPNAAQGSSAPQTIIGYVVSDMVTVTARDISRLGALLDKAVNAGANAMYGVSYGENDPGALLDKARPLAVADARRKAEIYANAGGSKIGRLMSLTEQPGAPPVRFAGRASIQSASAPTPIEAGEDKLTVSVTAQFELTQ